MKRGLILMIFCACILSLKQAVAEKMTIVVFYDHLIVLPTDRFTPPDDDGALYPGCGSAFKQKMDDAHAAHLISALQNERQKLELNDWLYYRLLRLTATNMFPNKNDIYRTFFCWYILRRSGFNTLLYESRDKAWIFVRSHEQVYDLPYIETPSGRYINLTYFYDSDRNSMKHLYSDEVNFGVSGKDFQFRLSKIPPCIKPVIEGREFNFVSDGVVYHLNLQVDVAAAAFVKAYPALSLDDDEHIPLSDAAYNSLIPQFQLILADKSPEEALPILLSFTRTAFTYKTDLEAYHKLNIMFSPEETLTYPFSDCEDRAILFSYLVHTLMHKKTLFLAFPDHVMVGVAMPHPQGEIVQQGHITYTVCEPTGPQDVLAPGEISDRYRNENFTVSR